ncbi:MAG: SprT family zinc-dependent metalloprotease [Candidatus Omnitrophota bacterium]
MSLSALSGQESEVGASQLRFFIVRSQKRRTLQLSVGVRGVEVRAPVWVSDQEIDAFVQAKQNWIQRSMHETGIRLNKADVFMTGGPLYVLGGVSSLEIVRQTGKRALLEELANGWRVQGDRDAAYRLIVKWYRLKAAKIFQGLLELWARRMGMPVPACVVKQQQRLWGSYSAHTGTVSLNWRMLSFPIEIIEYIVIHELCHVRHLHHRKSFWDEVSLYCPNWHEHRFWLKTKARGYLFDPAFSK